MNQDIGIASNDAEPLYLAISNSTGAPAVVIHDDAAAAQINTWTEWIIPLQAFADQGIGPDVIFITHNQEITLDEKARNLELSEWIWQNVEK